MIIKRLLHDVFLYHYSVHILTGSRLVHEVLTLLFLIRYYAPQTQHLTT